MATPIRSRLIGQVTHAVPQLDRGGLRRFGLTSGLSLMGLFGVLLPWALRRHYPSWPWALGGLLIATALLIPRALSVVYVPWTRLALLFGRVTSALLAAVVYFVVMTPVAWIIRTAGSDPMKRRLERDAPSYRVPSRRPDPSSMERPF